MKKTQRQITKEPWPEEKEIEEKNTEEKSTEEKSTEEKTTEEKSTVETNVHTADKGLSQKTRMKLAQEQARIRGMWEDQRQLAGGTRFVFGIDEAGRGPLCGPVVAGCCLLPADAEILWLNDSKKLSEKKREMLYEEITGIALSFGLGIVDAARIDEINILQATFEAMRMAFSECYSRYHEHFLHECLERGEDLSMNLLDEMPAMSDSILLVDGDKMIPELAWRQKAVIGGDAMCPSISAASILAKVTRDRMMAEYDRQYPGYGFAKHKGYGTKQHMEAIRTYGMLPIHRRSFLKKL